MRLAARPGDIIECERSGIVFIAKVTGKAAGVLDVEPFLDDVPFRSVKPGQVRTLWRKVRT